MKASIYNTSVRLPNGTTLLFNSYTISLVALDEAEASSADRILKHPDGYANASSTRDLFDLLVRQGFVTHDAIDERRLLQEDHSRALEHQQKQLSLTILPSLGCNFRCTYCYQKENPLVMSPAVEDALLQFVRQKLHQGGGLSVNWFGGEPLLHMDIVERLSQGFIEACTESAATYSAAIVTNGYLLDEHVLAKLAEAKIRHAQITLDGPPQTHDQRRPLKGGQSTFWQILENVKRAADKLDINLRMNVDEGNDETIGQFIRLLVEEGLEKRVGFYLGRTYPYTDVCADIASFCLSDSEFSLLGLETLMLLLDRGFAYTFWLPSSKNFVCTADSGNSYVITPTGGIANCWNDASNPHREIGHLLKPTTASMDRNAKSWEACNPFKRTKCVKCKLLPMCMGGCPYMFQAEGRTDCHHWKHHLNESIAYYYRFKVMERESAIGRHLYEAVESLKQMKGASCET